MQQSLQQYYIFYTAAQCGNISGAAKKLFISQPAVSKAIAKLEEALHTPLFFRTPRGVTLTDAGALLYKQLDTAFCAIESGEEQLRRNEELGAGRLSIGVSTTLCKYVLMPYLHQFIEDNPHVKVSIFCQSTYETITGLSNGSLDLGLVGESDRLRGLIFHPLRTITDVMVTTEGYLSKLKGQIPDELFSEDPERELLSHATLLLLNKNNVTRQYVEKYLLMNNLSMEQLLEVTTMDLLIDFAKIGLGIACVIEEFVEKELKEGSLVLFPTREPIPSRKIGFAYTKGGEGNPALQRFLAGSSLS